MWEKEEESDRTKLKKPRSIRVGSVHDLYIHNIYIYIRMCVASSVF